MSGADAAIGTMERPAAPDSRRADLSTGRPPRGWRTGGDAGTLATAASVALDQRRIFVLVPFAIIAGLIVSVTGDAPTQPTLLWLGVFLLALLAVPAARSLSALRAIALCGSFLMGMSLLPLHGLLFGTPMLPWPAYGQYEMRVDEILSHDDTGTRSIVSRIVPSQDARELSIRRARLFIRGSTTFAPGDTIRAPIRFYPVPGPVVPGGYDTQFHSYFDGIGAYGSATGPVEVVAVGDASVPARTIDTIRRTIGQRIDRVLQLPSAGIARALITGDQSAVPDAARETMATAGLAHVLSISGLHLTLVAGGVFVVLRMALVLWEGLARLVSVKRVAAAGGILVALLYFSISGGSVAAVRATVMIMLVFGAVIVGRRALTMRNVAIAALVVLFTDPASVFRPSFQLSFAAVVALIGAWELARGREGRERGLAEQFLAYFGGIAVTSFVAGAATLLFSMYHFQQTSPLGVLGNLISLPLVGFVMMPAAVLAALAMPIGLEMPFLVAMGWSIDRMLDLAVLVATMSAGIDASPLLTPFALVLALGALAWFAFLPTWHRLIGPALLVPAVTLLAFDRPPDVLIADTTQALAIRTTDGLQIVAGKVESFAVDVWRETYSEPMEEGEIACDSIACVAQGAGGFSLALVTDAAGFYEECGVVDLVITRRDAPAGCAAPTIVDAGDLEAGGVHWLAWNEDERGFEVRRAITGMGQPWRIAAR